MERPKLKRDWIGLKMKSLRQIETRGGIIFPAGMTFEVTGNRGGLRLSAIKVCRRCKMSYRHFVTGVSERDVVIIGKI